MTRKGILSGAAVLAALGLALVDVNNVEAGRRRCCCNSYGWSGTYGTTQTTGYGPTNEAAPAPQTFDGSAQTYDGTAAPAPGSNQGNARPYPYGTQYGPRGTATDGPNGATGAVHGGTTTVNPRTNANVQGGANNQRSTRDGTVSPRTGSNGQGRQTAPIQNDRNNRLQNEDAAPPAPGSTSSDTSCSSTGNPGSPDSPQPKE